MMNDPMPNVVTMPHALGPEKAVLSVLFQYPEMLDEVPWLAAEHFHVPSHRDIFGQVLEFRAKGKPLELVSFIQTLLDMGRLDRVGGPSALAEIYTYQPSPGCFHEHVAHLREKLARRMTILAGAEMQRVAFEAGDSMEILDVTSAPITAIHETLTATAPAVSTRAVLRGCMDRYEQLCKGEADPMGIGTSLIEIDKRFRGLHPRQTVIVSGYPGSGKTTLAGQLAFDAALDGHNTLVCSLEMPAEKMMERMITYVSRLPARAITDPVQYARETHGADGPTTGMIRAVDRAVKTIAECPFVVEDLTGANVYQIAACIRRAHRIKPLEVVVVDYAQRIRPAPEMRKESREQQLSHASNSLADLCKELGFCLLLPSQLNKEGATKHAEALNEDADLHLQILQGTSGADQVFRHRGIAVVKDRHNGQDGNMLPIILDGPMLRFVPAA